jgi:hypothetical protein
VLACVLAGLLVPALASASPGPYAETRVGGLDLGNPYSVRAIGSLTLGTHQGYALAYDDLASDYLLAARGGAKLLEAAKTQRHHVFPQQFRDFFAKRGVDIDEFTVPLTQGQHLQGVHGTGNALAPGRWNQVWDDFIRANPNATAKEIYQQAGTMMDDFGLSGLPISPY